MPPRLMMGEYTNEFGAGGGSGGLVGTGAYTPPPLQMGVLGQYGNMGVNFLNPNAGALTNNILSGAMQNVGMPTMPTQTAMQNFGAKAGNFLGNAANFIGKGIGLLGGPATIGAGLLGLAGLSSMRRNKPKNINQDFSFDMARSSYKTNPALNRSISQLNAQGGMLRDMSMDFQRQSDDFLNPDSEFMRRQRASLREDIADNTFTQQQAINQGLAQRGVGGSVSSFLNAATANRSAESARKGFADIMNRGVGYATQYDNMGLNALNAATGAYGSGGNLASAADARALQNAQFNAQNENTYNQYLKMAEYNQMVQNRNAQAAYGNSRTNNLFNLAGTFLGMG